MLRCSLWFQLGREGKQILRAIPASLKQSFFGLAPKLPLEMFKTDSEDSTTETTILTNASQKFQLVRSRNCAKFLSSARTGLPILP